jgi:hypothetical protein
VLGVEERAAAVNSTDVGKVAVLSEGETDLYEKTVHLSVKLYSEKWH